MTAFNVRMLASASFVALVAGATPAFAQGTDSAACATITDEAQKQACLDQADSTDPTAQEGDAATIPPGAAPAQEEQGAIVVTGSRLRRSEFNSPDPVTIINPELSRQKGETETAEAIQNSPIAAGSTQITAALSSNFVTQNGGGAQTVGLRGLGAERTLVLLNGRRAGPAGVRGQIAGFDLNVLPVSIANSIEILKTGASSIYGSDAIAGVINIITKKDTGGIEVRATGNVTEDGGGNVYNVNAAWGKDFGRGHILLAADYYHRDELEKGDRKFLDCAEEFLKAPDQFTRRDLRDPDTGGFLCGGTQSRYIQVFDSLRNIYGASAAQTNIPAGTVLVYDYPGSAVSTVGIPIPARFGSAFLQSLQFSGPAAYRFAGNTAANFGLIESESDAEKGSSVIPETDRYSLFADGSYEVSDTVELFAEGLFSRRKNRIDGIRQLFPEQFTGNSQAPADFCITFDLGCNPASLGDPFNTEFTGVALLTPVSINDHGGERVKVDYYRGVGGVRADISSLIPSWNVEAFTQYSLSKGTYNQDIIFQDAFDILEYRTEACAPGQTTSIRHAPCVDIDLTDPRTLAGDFTQAERDFLFGDETGHTRYSQLSAQAYATGNLFSLPAGDIKMAIGVEWRKDKINDTPGEETLRGNSWGRTSSGITAGYGTTTEAFGELEVPLLRDAPFFRALTLSGAGRVTNAFAKQAFTGVEDKDNGNWTYKLGANWEVNPWLRFRGSYGTSFRAPALYEQFLAGQTGFLNQTQVDPCLNLATRLASPAPPSAELVANCTDPNGPGGGVALTYAGGTSDALTRGIGGIGVLDPETSKAMTLSVILTPTFSFLPNTRVSLALDYVDIKVKGEIARIGANNVVALCYASDFFPDDPLCDQFTRNPQNVSGASMITEINDPYLNINKQHNRAIDVTGRIRHDLGKYGSLSFLAQMTWQMKDDFELFAGTTDETNGEVGDPIWVGDFSLTWTNSPWTVVWGVDAIGGTDDKEDLIEARGVECFNSAARGGLVCPDTRLSPTFYHSFSVSRQIGSKYEVTLGVANAFDVAPPRASTALGVVQNFGQAPLLGTYYDWLGRRFFGSIRAKF